MLCVAGSMGPRGGPTDRATGSASRARRQADLDAASSRCKDFQVQRPPTGTAIVQRAASTVQYGVARCIAFVDGAHTQRGSACKETERR